MYKLYLLQSLKHPNKTYVGMTLKEIKNRLREHNEGLSKYTRSFLPWKLIYYEVFYCKLCADKREQFLKAGVGYNLRKLILRNYEELYSSLKNGE